MKRAVSTGFRGWIAYPILLFVALLSWTVASPPGSAPDDDYHLVSAWCAWGTRDGMCEPGSNPGTRYVPRQVLEVACYKFDAQASGACPPGVAQLLETDRGNFASYYPNGFYSTMALFTGPSVEQSVLWMRLFNSLLYAGGLAALLLLVQPARRANYALGSLVTLVPLGSFVVASANPSSWAFTSATLLWATAVEFGRAIGWRAKLKLGALATLALVLAMSSRADAAAYAAVALVLAWLASVNFNRRTLLYGGAVAVVLVIAAFWVLSFDSVRMALNPDASLLQPEPIDGWFQRLQEIPGVFFGVFGTYSLGWLDTPIRAVTWVLAGSMFAGVVFWGLRRCGWRKAVALLVVIAVGIAVPLVTTTLRHTMTEILQPRYFLPLVVLLAMIAIAENNDAGPELHRAQAVLLAGAIGLAHANALHTNIRRYVTGLDDLHFDLNVGVEWWWSWAPAPMLVFSIGALAFLAAAVVAVSLHSARPLYAGVDGPPPPLRRALVD